MSKFRQAQGFDKVLVATDHSKIFNHITEFGGKVCMTSENHPSGTDRCREALESEKDSYDFVVNIQGDEPFVNPQQIEDLIKSLSRDVQISTQAKLIDHEEESD